MDPFANFPQRPFSTGSATTRVSGAGFSVTTPEPPITQPGGGGTNIHTNVTATVEVGSTTTGDPGTSAAVTNSGSSSAAVFDFTIPRGNAGADGIYVVGAHIDGDALVFDMSDGSTVICSGFIPAVIAGLGLTIFDAVYSVDFATPSFATRPAYGPA